MKKLNKVLILFLLFSFLLSNFGSSFVYAFDVIDTSYEESSPEIRLPELEPDFSDFDVTPTIDFKSGLPIVVAPGVKDQIQQNAVVIGPVDGGSTVTYQVVRRGSTGEYVVKLQNWLLMLGYSIGTADGIFGYKTETAVKQFQSSNGLTADGVVGAKTWEVLGQAVTAKATGNTIIKRGSTGDKVRELQNLLLQLGYSLGAYGADGSFGAATESALISFQRDYGLTADGVATAETWSALRAAIDMKGRTTTSEFDLRARLITILKNKGYVTLNYSYSYDYVVDKFLSWHREYYSSKRLRATYLALPSDYRMTALNHWTGMIEQGYSEVSFTYNLLPSSYYDRIPARPRTDSVLGSINEENKYSSTAALNYYIYYYYPIDAYTTAFYDHPDSIAQYKNDNFRLWAMFAYGMSASEAQSYRLFGILMSGLLYPVRTTYDTVQGISQLPLLIDFVLRAAYDPQYQQAFKMMMSQAIEEWTAAYNSADPYEQGYMIGSLIGDTLSAALGAGASAKAIKDYVTSGAFRASFKTLINSASGVLKKLKTAITTSIDDLNYTISKVYSRFNGVVEVEFAGYGRLRFDEAEILQNVDQPDIDRYTKWIESKLAETASDVVERVVARVRALGVTNETEIVRISENAAQAMSRGSKFTEPTLALGSTPKGSYEVVTGDSSMIRSITRQNEAANLLAKEGYNLEMLPNKVGGNGYGLTPTSNPDFKIDGDIFDCYSPDTLNVRNIWSNVQEKVSSQANRIVLNLDDFSGSLDDLAKQFNDWPIEGLRELFAMKNGKIARLFIK